MYQVLLCTGRAIILLIKAFVLPRSCCRCRRGLLKNGGVRSSRTQISLGLHLKHIMRDWVQDLLSVSWKCPLIKTSHRQEVNAPATFIIHCTSSGSEQKLRIMSIKVQSFTSLFLLRSLALRHSHTLERRLTNLLLATTNCCVTMLRYLNRNGLDSKLNSGSQGPMDCLILM